MLNIKTFQVNPLQENCYIVSDESGECVIIDCGAYYDAEREAVANHIRQHHLSPVHLLCTHGHFDHTFGNDTIYALFGLMPEIHAADAPFIENLSDQCAAMNIGMSYDRPSPPIGHLLSDGDDIGFGSHTLRVIHTPGHSPGGVLFHCETEHVVFTGDTLFRMSVGRTDLPGGSWPQLMKSLHDKVAPLPADTIAYPGHGPATRIGDETTMNPYFTLRQ